MATSYSSLLRLELPGNGEQSGIWGSTTNNNLGTLLDQAIAGTASITMLDADYTLSAYNGVTDEARQMILNVGGTLTANRNIICPATSKLYVIKNNTTGGFSVTLKTASGTGVTVTNGNTTIAYCDNTNVVDSVTALPAGTTVGTLPIVTTTGTQTLTNKTLTAPKFADGGFIADANGNEIVVLDTVTSAVNEITVANAATGAGPRISVTGSDSNIDLNLVPKGTGVVNVSGTLNGLRYLDVSNSDTNANSGSIVRLISSDVAGTGNAAANIVKYKNGAFTIANAETNAAAYINLNVGSSERMRIDSSGNVGIGTTSPARRLDVIGGRAGFASNDVYGLVLGYNETRLDAGENRKIGVTDEALPSIVFSSSGAGTERIRFADSGQIGIGGANYGTAGQVLTSGGASAAPSWATPSAASGVPDVILEDNKSSNTGGGTGTADAWTTRTLNTPYRNLNSLATLSSNQFTLPAGTYYINCRSPFYYADGFYRIRLWNVTSNSQERLGYNAYAIGGSSPNRPNSIDANLDAVVTLASSTTFRIEYYCDSFTSSTANLGVASNLGTEIYTSVKIWKL